MSPLENQLNEDRIRRDAALAVFKSDLALIRADLADRGIGGRLADRVGDATMDMLDEAVDYAEDHRGRVAAIVAAVVVWFARGPIIDALTHLAEPEPEPEPERLADRLRALNPLVRERQ